MARQKGTLNLSSNVEPRFSAPTDARIVVDEKNDLYAMEYGYRGMLVYVKGEDCYYKLVNDLPAYPASWVFYGQEGMDEITEAEIDAMF